MTKSKWYYKMGNQQLRKGEYKLNNLCFELFIKTKLFNYLLKFNDHHLGE
jgi:hypothetical protein